MYNTMETLMASVTVLRQTTGIASCQEFSPFLKYKQQSVFLLKAFTVLLNGREGGKRPK